MHTMKSVLVRAHMICSDGDCDFTLEFEGSAEEADSLLCDCGYGMAVIGWPDELLAA